MNELPILMKHLLPDTRDLHPGDGTSYQVAREIMGRNFFGFEEGIRHFGADPRFSHFKQLARVPFSVGELEAAAKTSTFITFFDLSMRQIISKVGQSHVKPPEFYNSGNAVPAFGCAMVHKKLTMVDWGSTSGAEAFHHTIRSWYVFHAVLGHFLATGEWLLGENESITCRENPDSASSHVQSVYRNDQGKLTAGESCLCHGSRRMCMSVTFPKTEKV